MNYTQLIDDLSRLFVQFKQSVFQFLPNLIGALVIFFSGITYWLLVFFFLTVATETLGLPVVTAWMSGIASYLPKILATALIGCAGLKGCRIIIPHHDPSRYRC